MRINSMKNPIESSQKRINTAKKRKTKRKKGKEKSEIEKISKIYHMYFKSI